MGHRSVDATAAKSLSSQRGQIYSSAVARIGQIIVIGEAVILKTRRSARRESRVKERIGEYLGSDGFSRG